MNPLPELAILFQRFGMALALGLMIGVEREHPAAFVIASYIQTSSAGAPALRRHVLPIFVFMTATGMVVSFVLI